MMMIFQPATVVGDSSAISQCSPLSPEVGNEVDPVLICSRTLFMGENDFSICLKEHFPGLKVSLTDIEMPTQK